MKPTLCIVILAALTASCVDLGVDIGPGHNPEAADARPALEVTGALGDPCEQALWTHECAPGLECLQAPLGPDKYCSRECQGDSQCPLDAACYGGACVERCIQRDDSPWPCPWGEERVIDGECLCLPGVSR